MSLYEFHCIRSGWMLTKEYQEPDKAEALSDDDFDRLFAAHETNMEQATRELSVSEVIAANKDKLRST